MARAAANYRLGTVYALVTTALLASQHPFSVAAAQQLSAVNFVLATQIVILLCVPLLLRTSQARRDFRELITSTANLKYFALLLAIGLGNHVLYFLALSKAHPITIAAVMNLSPFWAALVAAIVTRKSIPTSHGVFFGCLAVAFVGAMAVAFSQSKDASFSLASLGGLSPYWLFAVPTPILFALSGTLIEKWFPDRDKMACIAVTFVTAAAVLIPITVAFSYARSDLAPLAGATFALLSLAVGTVLGSAVGLVVYQTSLSVTDNDNGFVSMFFLLGPGVTALLSLGLSPWLPQLAFQVGPLFYVGLVIVAASLVAFSWRTRRGEPEAEPPARVADALAD